tara:strand:+ start:173 stop:496 length:324 start_codon:yes stop_codon:yes gene_type:complete
MISEIIIPYKIEIGITNKFIEPLKRSFSTRRNNPKNKKSPPFNQSLGLLNSTRIKGNAKTNNPTQRKKYPKIKLSIFFQYELIFPGSRRIEKLKSMNQKRTFQISNG